MVTSKRLFKNQNI